MFLRSLQYSKAFNIWHCLSHSQNKWINQSKGEVVVTLPTVTISDPLTKFLLPFLVTLCSADLEAPVPPRVFQPRDTEQRGSGEG